MQTSIRLFFIFLSFWFMNFIACSEVKFSSNTVCETSSTTTCISENGVLKYTGSETFRGGKVDIIIIDDNSASMSAEQKKLSSKFGGFIDLLESKSIDYRLAITTTDISKSPNNEPRTINQNGALQDGKLVTFQGGYSYLTPSTLSLDQRKSLFLGEGGIMRPETLTCDKFISDWIAAGKSINSTDYTTNYHANCPSTDERGIYAAHLVISKNPNGFIRPEADLAVILLSNEDVRSQNYWYKTPGYDLETLDTAQGYVDNVKAIFPGKKQAFHSIIVKSESCMNQENSYYPGILSSSYGWEYFNVSQLTGGISSDICTSDYSYQLRDIFNNVTTNIQDKIKLSCAAPQELTITPASFSYHVSNSEIVFDTKLPVGTQVSFSYKCPQSAN